MFCCGSRACTTQSLECGRLPWAFPVKPEEVAPAFVFFATETDSSYITGEVLTVNGADTSAA